MRAALVGDLHGNMPATLAVEKDIKARGITKIWCLGDVVGKGPDSDKTYDWAKANCEFILLGNWDEGISRRLFKADDFYYRQLGEKRMRDLGEFPREKRFLISGRHLRLIHGRPIMKELQHIQDPTQSLTWLFDGDTDLLGYADAHTPALRTLVSAPGQIFNIGSVGNSIGQTAAQYAILSGELNEKEERPLDISFVFLPYDREQAVSDALQYEDMPKRDAYIREVRTGIYSR